MPTPDDVRREVEEAEAKALIEEIRRERGGSEVSANG